MTVARTTALRRTLDAILVLLSFCLATLGEVFTTLRWLWAACTLLFAHSRKDRATKLLEKSVVIDFKVFPKAIVATFSDTVFGD
jgi:hypothetical protein